jgi:glucosylceramidase
MKKGYLILAIALFFAACKSNAPQGSGDLSSAELWLTNPDKSALFERQEPALRFTDSSIGTTTIEVKDMTRYQEIDGFGYTLTGGSAIHINGMEPAARTALLRELFSTDSNGIGVSYLRLTIGASDLSDHLFSYNDLPPGETDVEMKKFSLDPERKDLLPVLKEILQINPDIKILGSPWSPPTWMKTNNDTRGGSLKPEYYDAYAKYFVRYVEEMKKEGVRIDAITIQNEPLHPGNNPSLLMLAEEQAAFIKKSLGPAFKTANIDTKIILYDHNADRPDYPLTILNDAEARQYVDGSAFHLYAGPIDTLSKVHDAYPDKHLYFTEQWVGAPGNFPEDLAWHVRTLVIGATRNWCRNVLEWNLSSNPQLTPFTDRGGCSKCLGAVTIDGNNVTRNPAYYVIAHASKFVRPGSVRIESTKNDQLPNVAFSTPAGKIVLIVQNNSGSDQQFNIAYKGKYLNTSLKGGAAGTYVW